MSTIWERYADEIYGKGRKMSKKNKQQPIDAIKAIWEKYCDIVLEGYAAQIDEIIENQGCDCTACAFTKLSEKMKAFRHEFNKKT
jgi:hypothetical protein